MEFNELIQIVGNEPVFETALLLAGDVDPARVRQQLSRWTASGKLYQLRRGLYALAPPFRKTEPHPFFLAGRLVPGSYVSCFSALSYHGLIPERVPTVTSVTSGRPLLRETPFGTFEFKHLKVELLRGYRPVEVAAGQVAMIATPEKAILDLVYLHPGADSPAYLQELRLQNLEKLDPDALREMAHFFKKPKLLRAAESIAGLAAEEASVYETLS